MTSNAPSRGIRLLSAAVAALVLGACGSGDATSATVAAAPTASTGHMQSLSAGARAYVDAVNRADLDGLIAAFAADGEVVDVSRHIRGADAIRQWAANEVIGGSLRVDGITAVDPTTQRVRVLWAPSGSTGWAADYTFTTRGDLITIADLQYAR